MIRSAFQFEFRAFLRQPARWLAVFAFFLCGLFAVYGGGQYTRWWSDTIDQAQAKAAESSASRLSHFEENDGSVNLLFDNDYARMGDPVVSRLTPPVSGIAFGVADDAARSVGINIFTDPFRTRSMSTERIENPEHQLKGGIDLVFVFVFLLPLLMLVLCYDIGGYEVEREMVPLLSIQAGNPFSWMVARVISMAIVVTLLSITLCFAAAIHFGTSSGIKDWALLLLLVAGYIAVWTSAIVMIVAFRRSSSESALAISLAWVFVCLLVPAIVAQQSIATEASDYGVDFTVDARAKSFNKEWIEIDKDLVFRHFPELRDIRMKHGGAYPEGIVGNLATKLAKMKERHAARQKLDQQQIDHRSIVPWYSPAIAAQMAMERLAGVGLESTIAHRAATVEAASNSASQTIPGMWKGEEHKREEYEAILASVESFVFRQMPGAMHLLSLLVWFTVPVVIATWLGGRW